VQWVDHTAITEEMVSSLVSGVGSVLLPDDAEIHAELVAAWRARGAQQKGREKVTLDQWMEYAKDELGVCCVCPSLLFPSLHAGWLCASLLGEGRAYAINTH
jgi:hypothetical protein